MTTGVPGGSEQILLVDDEELLVQMETEILERLGYDVVGTSNPVEALETFRSEPGRFHLVITDLTMPHMSGIQLAKRVRHIKPGIPIILCSGFAGIKEKEESDVADISDFVTKPIIKNDLARIVRRVLDKSKQG
jgi:DNA-binding NtrC family response regulator